MIFSELFGKQIHDTELKIVSTRSNKVLFPIHSNIANIARMYTKDEVISLPEKEFTFEGKYGTKNVDIAIVDSISKNLKGAIMFKGIRSEYNKNSNNFYENMKGESSLFIDSDIPIYQIIFIPTKVRHKDSKGIMTFETPSEKSYNNYCNFIANKPNYWEKLKLGVYYFDVEYTGDYVTHYADKTVPGVERTLTEGIKNFIERIK